MDIKTVDEKIDRIIDNQQEIKIELVKIRERAENQDKDIHDIEEDLKETREKLESDFKASDNKIEGEVKTCQSKESMIHDLEKETIANKQNINIIFRLLWWIFGITGAIAVGTSVQFIKMIVE